MHLVALTSILTAWIFVAYGWIVPGSDGFDRLTVGGKYRIKHRRVRCARVVPSSSGTSFFVTWVDVDTQERKSVWYSSRAKFKRRRFGP